MTHSFVTLYTTTTNTHLSSFTPPYTTILQTQRGTYKTRHNIKILEYKIIYENLSISNLWGGNEPETKLKQNTHWKYLVFVGPIQPSKEECDSETDQYSTVLQVTHLEYWSVCPTKSYKSNNYVGGGSFILFFFFCFLPPVVWCINVLQLGFRRTIKTA